MLIGNRLMLSGRQDARIEQCTAVMADIVTGNHDGKISSFFANPLFQGNEDTAYLHGSHTIASLRLGTFGIRRLTRDFKRTLMARGFSDLEANIQTAQFRIYYWTMIICLTNGAERRFARKKVKRLEQKIGRLKVRTGEPAQFY